MQKLYTVFAKANGQTPMAGKRFLMELARARPRWYERSQKHGVDMRPSGVKFSTLLGVPRDATLRPAQYRQAKLIAVEDEPGSPPEGRLIEIQQQLLIDTAGGAA